MDLPRAAANIGSEGEDSGFFSLLELVHILYRRWLFALAAISAITFAFFISTRPTVRYISKVEASISQEDKITQKSLQRIKDLLKNFTFVQDFSQNLVSDLRIRAADPEGGKPYVVAREHLMQMVQPNKDLHSEFTDLILSKELAVKIYLNHPGALHTNFGSGLEIELTTTHKKAIPHLLHTFIESLNKTIQSFNEKMIAQLNKKSKEDFDREMLRYLSLRENMDAAVKNRDLDKVVLEDVHNYPYLRSVDQGVAAVSIDSLRKISEHVISQNRIEQTLAPQLHTDLKELELLAKGNQLSAAVPVPSHLLRITAGAVLGCLLVFFFALFLAVVSKLRLQNKISFEVGKKMAGEAEPS